MSSISIGAALQQHSLQLTTSLNLDPVTARTDVQCLLQAALCVNRAWLLTHPDQPIDPEQYARYMALFERRLAGEPVAYLLGEREFYGVSFKVSPATLIPRPETELLVELALQRIPPPDPSLRPPQPSPASGRGSKFRVLDLGTGSGAIALSIARLRPGAEIVAVDASAAALEVARDNVQRLGTGNVRLLLSDWFSALQGERFDVIVSNPPYVAAGDRHLTRGDVRFEPRTALVSGADGLEDIRRIAAQARDHLNVKGCLLLEHGYDQSAQVRAILRQAGLNSVFSAPDLAGIERVSGGLATA